MAELNGAVMDQGQRRCQLLSLPLCTVDWLCSGLLVSFLGCSVLYCVQSCLTLFDAMDCSSPGPSVRGTSQARILEWAAISSSRVSSPPRDRTRVSCVSCIGRQILYHCATWEALRAALTVLLSFELIFVTSMSWTSQVALMVKNPHANAGDTGDMGLISGLGRSPGGGHVNPLQYSCLENPMIEEPVGLQSMRSQRVGHD